MRGFFVYNNMNTYLIILLVIIGLYLLIGIGFWIWWCVDNHTFAYKHKDGGGIKPLLYMYLEGTILIPIWGIVLISIINEDQL